MKRRSSIRLAFLLLFGGAAFISQAASIEEARTQYHAGNLAPALAQTQTLLKANPESISALFLKAQIESENLQIDRAIGTYKKLIALDASHLQAYNNLAALYAQQGKLVLASETLEQAIRTDPVYTTIHANLRAIYMDMSKKHYRQALKLKPEKTTTQIASIDLSDNTDQILSEEVHVVPQSIQAAINTTTISNTVTSKRRALPTIETNEPVAIAETGQQKPVSKQAKKQNAVAAAAPAKVVTKPASVAKPKSKPKPKPKVEAKKDPALEVKKSLLAWANAWSNRDVKRYVGTYQSTYAPKGKTHKDWVAGRGWNFKNKKYIKVSLSTIHIKATGNRYRATFKQLYESDTYKDEVNKEILFRLQKGQWKIEKETTL